MLRCDVFLGKPPSRSSSVATADHQTVHLYFGLNRTDKRGMGDAPTTHLFSIYTNGAVRFLWLGDWLLGMYSGLTYGLKEARGTHDWILQMLNASNHGVRETAISCMEVCKIRNILFGWLLVQRSYRALLGRTIWVYLNWNLKFSIQICAHNVQYCDRR